MPDHGTGYRAISETRHPRSNQLQRLLRSYGVEGFYQPFQQG
jgi:hypothetical protein